jgi:hypothetical protein
VPFKTFVAGRLYASEMMTYLMNQVVAAVTSTTRPTSPVQDQLIVESDTGLVKRYDSVAATWRTWPPPPVQFFEGSTFSVTSTSYVAGSTECSGTFVAPPSGTALISVGGEVEGFSTEGGMLLSWEVRVTNSAGAVFNAATDTHGLFTQGVINNQSSYLTLLSGMTPGQTYFIRTMHRVTSAGTGTIFQRRLIVIPNPN